MTAASFAMDRQRLRRASFNAEDAEVKEDAERVAAGSAAAVQSGG